MPCLIDPTILVLKRSQCSLCTRESECIVLVKFAGAKRYTMACASCRVGRRYVIAKRWQSKADEVDHRADRMSPDEWRRWVRKNPPLPKRELAALGLLGRGQE